MVAPQRALARLACDPGVPGEKGAWLVVPRTSVPSRTAWADAGADSDGISRDEGSSSGSGPPRLRPGCSSNSTELASSPAPPDGGCSSRSAARGHADPACDTANDLARAHAGYIQPIGPVVSPHRRRLRNRRVGERDANFGVELGAQADAASGAQPGEGGGRRAAVALPIAERGLQRGLGCGAASSGEHTRPLEAEEDPGPARPEARARAECGPAAALGDPEAADDGLLSAGAGGHNRPRARGRDLPADDELSAGARGLARLGARGRDLPDDELLALVPHIPLAEGGELTSVGSIKHADGSCRPCAFFYTQVGCEKSVRCEFCHVLHRRKDRRRLGRQKRERYRDLVSRGVAGGSPVAELPWQSGQRGGRLPGGDGASP